MKTISSVLATLFLLAVSLQSDPDIYVSGSDFKLTISGTSNVHDWEESVDRANGQGAISWNTDGSFTLQSLQLAIATHSIKSTHGSIMDNKTYDALKADANPNITFKLTSPLTNVRPGTTITAKGELKIAGTTKTIDLPVTVSGTSTKLIFQGTKSLSMKDFGVSPPTAFMGAMKVADNVTVQFKASYDKKIIINQ